MPVGFKYFVDGLLDGSLGFGGEESAGASFLRKDGTVWTTDKDGIILDLLAAEITATTGRDPGEHYRALEEPVRQPGLRAHGRARQRSCRKPSWPTCRPIWSRPTELAGEKIIAKLTHAPGNNAAIGGLKVVTENGWFAARPPARKTSIKSTPRASEARSICGRSRTRPRPSWPARSERQDCEGVRVAYMPQTPHTDQQHRAILQSIAHRAMLERGLLPDFSAAVLAELDRIQAPAGVNGESARRSP